MADVKEMETKRTSQRPQKKTNTTIENIDDDIDNKEPLASSISIFKVDTKKNKEHDFPSKTKKSTKTSKTKSNSTEISKTITKPVQPIVQKVDPPSSSVLRKKSANKWDDWDSEDDESDRSVDDNFNDNIGLAKNDSDTMNEDIVSIRRIEPPTIVKTTQKLKAMTKGDDPEINGSKEDSTSIGSTSPFSPTSSAVQTIAQTPVVGKQTNESERPPLLIGEMQPQQEQHAVKKNVMSDNRLNTASPIMTTDFLKKTNKELQNENEEQKMKVKDLEAKLLAMEEKIKDKEVALVEKNNLVGEVRRRSDATQSKILAENERSSRELKSKVKSLQKEKSGLTEKIEQLETMLSSKEEKIDQHQSKIDEMKKEASALKVELSDTKSKFEQDLARLKSEEQKKYETLVRNRSTSMDEERGKNESEKMELKRKLTSSEIKFGELKASSIELGQEKEHLEEKLKSLQKKHKEDMLRLEKRVTTEANEAYTRGRSHASDSLSRENEFRLKEFEESHSRLQDDIRIQRDENDKVRKLLSEKGKECKDLRRRLEQQTKAMGENVQELQSTINEWKEKYEKLQEAKKESEAALEKKLERNDTLLSLLRKGKASVEQKLNTFQSKYQELEQQAELADQYKSRMVELENRLIVSQKKCVASKREAENLRLELELRNKTSVELSQKLFRCEQQLNTSRLKKESLKTEMKQIREAYTDMQAEFADQKSFLTEQQEREKVLRRQLDLVSQKVNWSRDKEELLRAQLRQHVVHNHQLTLKLNESMSARMNAGMSVDLAHRESGALKAQREMMNASILSVEEENNRLRSALTEVCKKYCPDLLK
eukprot:g1596.t1